MGYTTPAEFYVPKYNVKDESNYYRETVFWTPNINSDDNGSASTDFLIADKDATYSLFIQGITKEGLIINSYSRLKK